MATIESAIRLNDMMSAPLRHIISAMDGMLSSWNSLEASTSGGLDVGNMESIRANLKLASQGLDDMEAEQKQFNREIQNGSNAMEGLTNTIMGAVGAYAGLQGLKQLVDLSDTYTQTTARLSMIVDEGTEVEELNDRIFASAQRARAGYQEMADTVAKLSLNAGDAFTSNNETILFAENLNKLFAIAGTEQASISSATLQLTQALGSGVLRGEEFNAVFEAAPNIMQTVADYMGVPIGQLRSMAQEGKITADIVKNALLGATDKINDQFQDMPMTWAQVWTGVMNELYYASMPILEAINWMAQQWEVLEPIVLGVAAAVGLYTAALLIHNGISAASAIIEGIRAASVAMSSGATFAATVAQYGWNAALMACPITWILLIIIAVIAAIYAIVAAINKVTGSTLSATGIIMGVLTVATASAWNSIVALINGILGAVNSLVNPLIAFINFFGNLFNDPIGAIIHLFGDLADVALGVLETIAKTIDNLFGTNFASTVSGWRSGLEDFVNEVAEKYGNGTYETIVEGLDLSAEGLGLGTIDYGDAWNAGYEFGEGLEDTVGDLFGTDGDTLDELLAGVTDTSEYAGDIANSLNTTNENLKYLRDVAEQDTINRFTTAEIRVEMGGVTNTVNQNTDLDGVVNYMVSTVQEAMERVAEGVHD